MAKPSLIRPTRRLRDKVPKSGGPTPEQAILRALNAADGLIGAYQGWAVDDLEALWRVFQDASAKGQADVRKMYDIAHEIRGQGGTFGFPLITAVADSLCKFLDGRKRLAARHLEIIRIHILAMKAVFRQGLKGPGGTLAKELPQMLTALRTHTAPGRGIG